MKSLLLAATACIILFFSCRKEEATPVIEFKFDFNTGLQGWDVLFSDYPVGEENFYELAFEHTGLPDPLNTSIKSVKINGNNHSDDLLSMIYRKIDGLEPHTRYVVTINVELASNACSNCPGAGGSPDLCLGGGALPHLPANEIEAGSQMYRPNFTSTIQSCAGNNAFKVLGKIGTGEGLNLPFKLISLSNTGYPFLATANANGELWILIGTDSGFEGITTLYYKQITVQVTKVHDI